MDTPAAMMLEVTLDKLMAAIAAAEDAGLVTTGCWTHDTFDPEVLAQAYDEDGDPELCLSAVVFNQEQIRTLTGKAGAT